MEFMELKKMKNERVYDIDCKVNIIFERCDDGSCKIGDMTIIPNETYEGPYDIESLIQNAQNTCISVYPHDGHYPVIKKTFEDVVSWSKAHAIFIRSPGS